MSRGACLVLCGGAQTSLQGAPHGCIMCCRVSREGVGRDSPECMVSTGRGAEAELNDTVGWGRGRRDAAGTERAAPSTSFD